MYTLRLKVQRGITYIAIMPSAGSAFCSQPQTKDLVASHNTGDHVSITMETTGWVHHYMDPTPTIGATDNASPTFLGNYCAWL